MKMINLIKKAGLVAILGVGLVSCDKDTPLKESIFDYKEQPKTELDQWIFDSYIDPYNIRATYKWNQAFGYYDKTLYPPSIENVKPALGMVKKLWIDTYTEVGGENFVKKLAPRELHLIGSYNINDNNTITLGEAGGGARITLFNVDFVKSDDAVSITNFIHTIQHEYVHILNQSKPYDKVAWAKISPGGLYSSQWNLFKDPDSNNLGFVTSYARSNYDEDFAETASFVLLKSKNELAEFLAGIKDPVGKAAINAKIELVVAYYKQQFGFSFWDLRDAAERHTNDVINGNF